MTDAEVGCSRWNNSSRATVQRKVLFVQDSFNNVYKGMYTEDQRAGEACAAKEMKSGSTWLAFVFDSELDVVNRAADII